MHNCPSQNSICSRPPRQGETPKPLMKPADFHRELCTKLNAYIQKERANREMQKKLRNIDVSGASGYGMHGKLFLCPPLH